MDCTASFKTSFVRDLCSSLVVLRPAFKTLVFLWFPLQPTPKNAPSEKEKKLIPPPSPRKAPLGQVPRGHEEDPRVALLIRRAANSAAQAAATLRWEDDVLLEEAADVGQGH